MINQEQTKTTRIPTGYSSYFHASAFEERVLREGKIIDTNESPSHMIERMVTALFFVERKFGTAPSSIEQMKNELGKLLDNRLVVMSTPIMTNAGRYQEKPLSACTVPPLDKNASRENIKSLVRRFHKDGMGTGFNFNEEKDPVSFLKYLNNLAVEGALSGKEDRPVGNMGIISVYHPKVLDFIQVKVGSDKKGDIWKFNISIDVDDAFMEAVKANAKYQLWNEKKLNAHRVLQEITQAAHECGDPGIVFIHRLNRDNPTPGTGSYVSTAPCGEMGLAPGETCQFGYINVGLLIVKDSNGKTNINYSLLENIVRLMTRVLDNALEISMDQYPHPLNRTVMRAKRKIGIGICGVADMLIRMKIPYASNDARELTKEVVGFINYFSKLASHELAKERGPFLAMSWKKGCRYTTTPNYIEERYSAHEGRENGISRDMWKKLGDRIQRTRLLRNASTVALPPTGRSGLTISASTGIEPLFSLVNPDGTLYASLESDLRERGLYSQKIRETVNAKGTLQPLKKLPDSLRTLYKTALEIKPIDHLRIVAHVQPAVDEAISKTINLPQESTSHDIEKIYIFAHTLGLKGVTIFRTGSRTLQPRKVVHYEKNSNLKRHS